jgi:holliday junction DNA helicase RuvA
VIGRLRGALAGRTPTGVVVDVAGVGYEVAMTARDVAALPSIGEDVVVHTHLHVREDQMAMFGFAEEGGRDMFRLLIVSPGVGPKLALAVLATLTPDEVRAAVVTEDVDTLATVPGIGKRTAQKLILDLRARLDAGDTQMIGGAAGVPAVRDALEGLGYSAAEIREALEGLDPGSDVEDLLRAALQRMGRP